jgi:predicted RNA-binding protein with PUA-like domain
VKQRSGVVESRTLLNNGKVKQYWLVKQEPSSYSWTDFVRDGKTAWTGVRNFTARNNLRAMRNGDAAFFYHSVTDKAVVGIAKVVREAYPDPTANEGDWSAVDLAPEKALPRPVALEEIKQNAKLKEMALLRLSRLSVQPVTKAQFDEIVRMSKAPSN